MRFWRRNVPDELAPDADTMAPATEPAPPPSPPSPHSEAEIAAPVLPRTWFDRVMGVPTEPAGEAPTQPAPIELRCRKAAGSVGCALGCRVARAGSTRASTPSSRAAGSTPRRSMSSRSC